tara:strand:- start:4614 stop:5168 length:555 start_codon:yes stop_codon:yes gene_type:complete
MSAEKAERELLRPVEDHELESGGNFWKYFWRAIGTLMIILIISYMLTNYTVMSIIAGRADSDVVSGNSLDSAYGSVVFSEGTYEKLKELYHANEKEFKACLIGDFSEGNYLISEVFLPKMHFQDYDRVLSSPCPEDTLIDMHSHPQQHCTFSQVDLEGFDPMNENTIMSVMCYDDRFIFHGKEI